MKHKIVVLLVANFFIGTYGRLGIFGQFDPVLLDKYPKCKQHLDILVTALKNGDIWALKIADASTKLPAGIITGHITDYGNFDECLEDNGKVPTQYCQAKISLPQELQNQIIKNDSNLISNLALRWAYCIPASCPTSFLQSTLENLLKDKKLNVTVEESDCIWDNQKHITAVDYFGILIWVFFGVLATLSTIYDVIVSKRKGKTNKWIASFSLYANGSQLLNTKTSSGNLEALHGLKFLSMCWIVLGHRYFFTATSSLLNLSDFGKELGKIQSQLFIQGVLAVDTFFLLSGFLNCYKLTKHLEKNKGFPLIPYYFGRYIRLTPALAVIVLMYATWYTLLGDGPAWNQTTAIWKQFCVDNWIPTLFYINNYYNSTAQCAGQSWYLAVDMQLYALSPFIIYPIWKWPFVKKLYLGVLLIVSIISPFVVAYKYKFRMAFTLGLNAAELAKVTEKIYSPTHTRGTPYIMGIIIAYYLLSPKKISKRISAVLWILSTIFCLSIIFGNYQFSRPLQDHPYNRWESSFYIALHRLGWSFGISWVIVACLTKHGGIVNSILSWKVFQPLSRLTYCIFLTHMAIQKYHVGTARTSDYFQHFNQIHDYFGDLSLSILAATVLNLLFESPFLVLGKLILNDKAFKKKSKGETNAGFQNEEEADRNVRI